MRRGVLIVLVVAVFGGVFGFPAQAQVPACTNDLFDDAIEITQLDDAHTCDTSAAGTAGEPAALGCEVGTGLAKTVWWKYTPTVATSTHVKINTYESTFNTVVALYEDTGPGLTLLACNNDASSTNSRSRTVQALQLNHTYYIRVGGVTPSASNGGGTLEFRIKRRLWKPGVVRGNDWLYNDGFNSSGVDFFHEFGVSSDRKLVGAWAPAGDGGDGIDTPWVRRGNLWITNDWFDSSFATQFHFGASTDFPLLGDWNRDEVLSPGVRRSNIWYLNNGQDGIHDISVLYARSTDYPLVGDWDGDGIWTPGVRRGNVFYLNNNFDAAHDIAPFAFGRSTDFPVVGDWNGDGKMTIGLVRGRDWFLSDGFNGVQTIPTFGWGFASDFKIVGDWNGAVE